MKTFKQNKTAKGSVATLRPRHRTYPPAKLVAAAGLILIIFLLLVIVVQGIQYFEAREEITERSLNIDTQESRNQQLREEIRRLHENEYIELLARKYLGLVKPGETIFKFQD